MCHVERERKGVIIFIPLIVRRALIEVHWQTRSDNHICIFLTFHIRVSYETHQGFFFIQFLQESFCSQYVKWGNYRIRNNPIGDPIINLIFLAKSLSIKVNWNICYISGNYLIISGNYLIKIFFQQEKTYSPNHNQIRSRLFN